MVKIHEIRDLGEMAKFVPEIDTLSAGTDLPYQRGSTFPAMVQAFYWRRIGLQSTPWSKFFRAAELG